MRIYDAEDAARMEGSTSAADGGGGDENSSFGGGDDDDGIDGLRSFRDKFEHSVVIFVLPSGQQQRDQLGRRDSFVSTAQRDLLRRDGAAGGEKKVGRLSLDPNCMPRILSTSPHANAYIIVYRF